MATIKKVWSKYNSTYKNNYEPFAAIKHDGSYAGAAIILGMIGLDNLDLPESAIKDGVTDELIDSLMDRNSNLKMPEIKCNEDLKLSGLRAMTLAVGSWLVMEVNDKTGYTEIVFYPKHEFENKYRFTERR